MAMRMTLCGFCRRLTGERVEASPANGEQEAGPSKDAPPLPENVKIEEAYCRDCERFYDQLLTFGRGYLPSVDGDLPEPPARAIPQPAMTTGFRA